MLPALLVFALVPQEHLQDLGKPAPAVALRPERADLAGYACASCHLEVAEEWAGTAHALAWIDQDYQAALRGKRRPESCHGCHAPEDLFAAAELARPGPRSSERSRGVSCETCHAAANGVVVGPRGTQVDAHSSEVRPAMTLEASNALCAACHSTNIGPVMGVAKDFVERDASGHSRRCVACHMAPVERAWASGEGVPLRVGRSHAIQTPRDPSFLRRAFEPAWRTDGRSRVVIANRAGHRVPGLIGRELRFRAEVLDTGGQTIDRGELRLDAAVFLPVDGQVEIPLTRSGSAVRLVGEHLDPRAEKALVFLDERLEPRAP
jgi:nitrate/TMAO reductase-like tetraheme cytochrome c subunit